MEIIFSQTGHIDALIIFIQEDNSRFQYLTNELGSAVPWLQSSQGFKECSAKKENINILYAPDSTSNISRVIVVGLGAPSDQNELLDAIRQTSSTAIRRCREAHFRTVALHLSNIYSLSENPNTINFVKESVFGAIIGLYRTVYFKSNTSEIFDKTPDPESLILLGNISNKDKKAINHAIAEANGVAYAKELINGPANFVTPKYLAECATAVTERNADVMHCKVLGPTSIRKLGMNALLAVSAGADNEPRFIIMEYKPKGCENDQPIVLIGKGLTFDSGGICLKPSANMDDMKDDMSGAGAVLGVFHILGALRPKKHVIGILSCAENMPSSTATKPGDVIITLSGQTVEIVNTDAEGRLVLCDAITYAQKYWNPSCLIDIATLTGACVVALGQDVAGLFCRDEKLSQHIVEIGNSVGEKFWPMPTFDMYFETLKSYVADFKNSGTRQGGASVATAFLSKFVSKDLPWAHLDIAGPAYKTPSPNATDEGARGFAIRTLYNLLEKI